MPGPLVGAAAVGIGKAASWIAGGMTGKAGATMIAGAAGAGFIKGMADSEGPWAEPRQQAAELVFGDPNPVRTSLGASIRTQFSNDPSKDVQGLDSYYYGRPVNPPRNISNPGVAPGDMVFSLYNNRR